jgi:hypothetical protein
MMECNTHRIVMKPLWSRASLTIQVIVQHKRNEGEQIRFMHVASVLYFFVYDCIIE